MNLQELDKLIEKYYEGRCSDNEEHMLHEILTSGNLPPDYEQDIALISGLAGRDDITEPDSGFEARIMSAIDESETRGRIVSIKRKVYSAVSVAATLLIIASSYLMLRGSSEPQDTFSDPVLAYNATLEILGRVGETMNTGTDVISELSVISVAEDNLNLLSEPTRMVTRELESLKYIKKSMDILDMGSR